MNKATSFESPKPPTIVQPARTMFQRPDYLAYPLDVVVTVFNSARFRNRWKHFEDFESHCNLAGDAVRLWVVEVAFGDREFAVTSPNNERHLQLRTKSELWHKERSQNLMVQRIVQRHKHARWFAFIDADISFIRHDWADEARHALQHYSVIQMWTEGYDLNPQGHIIQKHRSFASCYNEGLDPKTATCDHYGGKDGIYFHPGFAHAWRREAFESVGGLIDWAVLGSGDHHMMHSLIGNVEATLNPNLNPNYCEAMRQWQQKAERHIQRNIGCMPGSIFHYWHGAKANRKYKDRWKILEETNFDHSRDLVVDSQGLYAINNKGDLAFRKFRDKTRQYFKERKEDES